MIFKDQNDLFADLIAHYQESHRHYHNLVHLQECFFWFDEIKHRLYCPNLVAIALFYHDIIYNPTSQTNEQDSGQFMQSKLKGRLPDNDIAMMNQYILATKDHVNPLTDTHKNDLDYLLDIDLAILGSCPDRFDEYNNQIRKEYSWVNSLIYSFKRKSVLKGFYDKDRIYLTDYFYKKLENQARDNLKRYL